MLHAAAENTGRKNYAKTAIRAPSHNFVGLYLRNYGMYRQSKKSLLNPYNMMNFGSLTLRSVGEFWAPQQISTGFTSCLRYILHRRSTEVNQILHDG